MSAGRRQVRSWFSVPRRAVHTPLQLVPSSGLTAARRRPVVMISVELVQLVPSSRPYDDHHVTTPRDVAAIVVSVFCVAQKLARRGVTLV